MLEVLSADGFLRPAFLVTLPAALLYVLVVSLVGHPRTRVFGRFLLPVARGVLVAGLLFAIAGPALLEETARPGRVEIAVDVSRSIGEEGRLWSAERVVALARGLAERAPDAELAVAAFGERPEVLIDGRVGDVDPEALREALVAPDLPERVGAWRSRLGPALAELAAAAPPDVERTRFVVTDGALERPPALVERATAPIAFAPVPARRDRNFRLLDVKAPRLVEEGAGLAFALSYRASEAARRPLVVTIDGVEVRRVDVDLAAGEGEIPFEGQDLAIAPGAHRLGLRLESGDEEPRDDVVSAGFLVRPRTSLLYVRGEGHRGERDPAPLRALRAQGLPLRVVEPGEIPTTDADWALIDAAFLDRVGPEELSPEAAAAIAKHVDEGGGLLLDPRARPGELLRWNENRLGPWLPLTGLPDPPKPPERKDPPPPDPDRDPPKRLEDPDPDKAKKELVDAPTLSLLLVIDRSPSMKRDSRLHFAKLGALATARELHPDDRIGVVTFHEVGIEAVPMQPARNLPAIEEEIMRIQTGGRGTDIERALDKAREILSYEDSAVKMVILLSDGGSSRFNVKATMEKMVGDGITVATVGVGSNFNDEVLTLIGLYGGGGAPIPARSAREIPSVLVDLTSGMIDRKKVRRRSDFEREEAERRAREEAERRAKEAASAVPRGPERRVTDPDAPAADATGEGKPDPKNAIVFDVDRGVTYTDELPWRLVSPLTGLHRAKEKSGAWVALRAEDARPVLAHWRVGDGIAAMFATGLEGDFADAWPLWEGYGPFLAQLAKFLRRDPDLRRFDLDGTVRDRDLDLTIVDAWARDDRRPFAVSAFDERGEIAVEAGEALGEGRFRHRLARAPEGDHLRVVAHPTDEPEARVEGVLVLPLPLEIARRGLDLEGLERGRAATGGTLVGDESAVLSDPPRARTSRTLAARGTGLVPWLLLLFLFDVVAKRLARREILA
ncbi:MAG: VWA domain-containing protein [Planctomycetota bacterium]